MSEVGPEFQESESPVNAGEDYLAEVKAKTKRNVALASIASATMGIQLGLSAHYFTQGHFEQTALWLGAAVALGIASYGFGSKAVSELDGLADDSSEENQSEAEVIK